MLSSLKLKDRLFYGWVIAVAFVFIAITLYGIHHSFGVFFKSIESEFNLTRAATSVIVSANMLLGGACGFVGGWALDRYGPRVVVLFMGLFTGLSLLLTSQTNSGWQLFITYSLLLAIGSGATYAVASSTIARWFNKQRGLALGIAGSGIGLAMVTMPPFATYLIYSLDWRMAYIIIGLITWLIVIPLSRLLRKDPYEIGAFPDGVNSQSKDTENEEGNIQVSHSSLSRIFRTRSFWFIMFAWLLYASSMFLVFIHLVPHATDIGISPGAAAGILSLIGGVGIAGRVLMGIASDRIGRKPAVVICTLLQAGAMVWLIWAQDLWMFYLFAVVFGFAYSGVGTSVGALVGDTFRLGNIGAIFGMLEIGFGIGAAIGPAMGGLIFDASNSYSVAFLIGGLAMLVATLFVALVRREAGGTFDNGRG